MAVRDASTAPAPAASLTYPPVPTGAKRFPHGPAVGVAHCTDGGDAGAWTSRRRPAHAPRPLPAFVAREAPGAPACPARPFGPPAAPLLHP